MALRMPQGGVRSQLGNRILDNPNFPAFPGFPQPQGLAKPDAETSYYMGRLGSQRQNIASNDLAHSQRGVQGAYRQGLIRNPMESTIASQQQYHGIRGDNLSQSQRGLLAGRGQNYGNDPQYPDPSNFDQSAPRRPTLIPSSYDGNYSEDQLTMGVPQGAMGLGQFPKGSLGYSPQSYTTGEYLPSGTGVIKSPNGGIGLRGINAGYNQYVNGMSRDGLVRDPSLGEADRQRSEQVGRRRDDRILANAKAYGLPGDLSTVAGARERAGSGARMRQIEMANQQADMQDAREHNKMIDAEIMKRKLSVPGQTLPYTTKEEIKVLEGLRRPMPGASKKTTAPSRGLRRPAAPEEEVAPVGTPSLAGGLFRGLGAGLGSFSGPVMTRKR